MIPSIWQTTVGDGPLVACALHNGHEVRSEVADRLRLDDAQRRYEEDPFTAEWTSIAPTRIIALHSRFELDLNRPREKAVYLSPADAWGLDVWRLPPSRELISCSLAAYDDFYAHLRMVLKRLVARHERVVVFDLHSYNQTRGGPDCATADPAQNPEINLGTGTMQRTFWAPVVERWLDAMRRFDYLGRRLDVRENVRFFGGHLPSWVHHNFPEKACALAIEVKKFFMEEWTGELKEDQHQALRQALCSAAAAVSEELKAF